MQRNEAAIKILLVDDSEDLRLMLRLTVDGAPGWEVVGEAKNGLEAVHAADELKPDLVILDVAMPVMSGLDAAPLIKRAAPNARVLFYSAFDDWGTRERARAIGADGFFPKHEPLRRLKAEVERL